MTSYPSRICLVLPISNTTRGRRYGTVLSVQFSRTTLISFSLSGDFHLGASRLNGPLSSVMEEVVPVLAETVQDLPLRFRASPFDLCASEDRKKTERVRADAVRALGREITTIFGLYTYVPPDVVPGLSVRLEQLVDLVRGQGVGDSPRVPGKYLLELLGNEPAGFECEQRIIGRCIYRSFWMAVDRMNPRPTYLPSASYERRRARWRSGGGGRVEERRRVGEERWRRARGLAAALWRRDRRARAVR
jgi:hypothetical protein